jgi:signal transduction histidine kinase/CheY-like chemotaxis protein
VTTQELHPLPLFIAALASMGLFAGAMSRLNAQGAKAFAFLMLATFVWAFASAMSAMYHDAGQMLLWRVAYVGTLSIPVAWFLLAVTYTGREHLLSRRLWLLAVEPVVVFALVLTTASHGLIWESVEVVHRGFVSVVTTTYGPVFYVHVIYSYSLVLVGISFFLFKPPSPLVGPKQRYTVVVSLGLPLLSDASLTTGLWPWQLEPTPIAVALSGVILAWGLFREGLFDLLPRAREQAFDELDAGFLVFHPKGELLDSNQAARKILRAEWSDLRSTPIEQIYERLAEMRLDATANGGGGPYLIALDVDGASTVYEVSESVVHRGRNAWGKLIALRDVTAWREAEATLERGVAELDAAVAARTVDLMVLNQRLGSVMGALPEGVVVVNGERAIVYLNEPAERLLGSQGKSMGIQLGDVVPATALEEIESQLTMETPAPLDVVWLDGESIVEVVALPFEGGPEEGGAVVVLREVTEARRIAESRERAEKLTALGQLAAGVAHDLNNFITGAVAAASILSLSDQLSATDAELVGELKAGGQRSGALVRKILEFSRESSSPKEPLGAVRLLNGASTLIRRLLPASIVLETEVAANAPNIQGNRAQIEQMLINVASNSRDAMPSGGALTVTGIRVSGASVPILEGRVPRGDWLQVDISDTGEGIDPEVLKRIFDPFFTTKDVGQGFGLGLSQAFGVMQDHEGEIAMKSEMGQGSTISLFFPEVSAAADSESSRWTEALTGNGERILLVEDDVLVSDSLSIALERAGFEVVMASDGAKALDIFTDSGPFDLVLSDVTMPTMSGPDLIRELVKNTPGVKAILMSGYSFEQNRLNLPRNVLRWLEKPFDVNELIADINEALDTDIPG